MSNTNAMKQLRGPKHENWPVSREWSRRSGLCQPGGTGIVDNTHCVPGRLSTPFFAVERGRGRGIEGLPLLVREAAHHGRGILASAVGEEAYSDGPRGMSCRGGGGRGGRAGGGGGSAPSRYPRYRPVCCRYCRLFEKHQNYQLGNEA
jgi:hypothetical protein